MACPAEGNKIAKRNEKIQKYQQLFALSCEKHDKDIREVMKTIIHARDPL